MSELTKTGFGFQDDQDDSLVSKSGVKFGLNTNATITKFAFNENAGAGGSPGKAIDITVKVGDREYRQRIFEITKVFDNNNNEITDTTSPEYIRGYNEQMKHFKAIMTHYMKLSKTEDQIKAAFATPIADFTAYGNLVSSLVQDVVTTAKPVDVFLQWQWNISEGQDRTYLELPKHLKDGSFITPHIAPVGSWKEEIEGEELVYKDDAGNKHRFHRSKNFMESNKGVQQTKGGTAKNAAMNQGAAQGQTAKKSEW